MSEDVYTPIEGTRRFIVTRNLVEPGAADIFEAMPQEFKGSIAEVHFADGSTGEQVGMEGSFSVDLDEEWREIVEEASNLIDLIEVDQRRLGEHVEHITSEEIEDLAGYIGGMELPEFDPDLLAADPDAAPRSYRYYKAGGITDQGSEGRCTGDCRLNFLTASPIRSFPNLTFAQRNQKAHEFYKDNQRNDEWSGESYSGSSVSAACRCLVRDGFIKSAGVTSKFDEMVWWLLYRSPLMISTPWFEGMYRTNSQGFIRPSGRKVGGHAILARAITQWRTMILRNSWGASFGFGGDGYLSETDAKWLIGQGLRAYTAVQVK